MNCSSSSLAALLAATALPGLALPGLALPAAAQTLDKVEWIASKASETPDELSQMFTTARVRATYSDGRVVENPLGYQMTMSNRDRIGGNFNSVGTLYDAMMKPITDPTNPGETLVSEEPDGSTIAQIGGKLYLINQFEYDWLLADGSRADKHAPWTINHADGSTGNWAHNLPTTMVLTEVAQDADSGRLTPVAQHPIDFSAVGGLVWACNASQTPWGTFLSSEENYGVDARQVEADRKVDPSGMNDTLAGITVLYHGTRNLANPYMRGITPEITIGADTTTEVVKHYAMGRGTMELGVVMPDQRTVLTAHDGTNKAMTLFVADRMGDLSSGTLYAASLDQKSAEHGGTFDVTWVRLGHASDDEIKAMVDDGITFSDIMAASDTPEDGYTEVFFNDEKTPEYLQVKNAKAAAFLETMRYAGIRGATTEFRKAEGVTFDPEGKVAYIAISDIDKGMLEGNSSGDAGDQIRLANVDAGAIYALPTESGVRDDAGEMIDSPYVPVSMHVPQGLMGRDLDAPDGLGNTADPDLIANGDNLAWSVEYKTLFIGEDSGQHTSNVLWAWQPGMEAPVRLLNGVAGGELTGLSVHANIGGHAYGLTNMQHVGDFDPGESATLQAAKAMIRARWDDRQKSPLGYVTGLPAAGLLAN